MSVQPTWPPAPLLFTTTIGLPRIFSASEATTRAPTSVLPPGGKATISCTGRLGKSSAWARAPAAASNAAAATAILGFLMASSSVRILQLGLTQSARRELQRGAGEDHCCRDHQAVAKGARGGGPVVAAGQLERS